MVAPCRAFFPGRFHVALRLDGEDSSVTISSGRTSPSNCATTSAEALSSQINLCDLGCQRTPVNDTGVTGGSPPRRRRPHWRAWRKAIPRRLSSARSISSSTCAPPLICRRMCSKPPQQTLLPCTRRSAPCSRLPSATPTSRGTRPHARFCRWHWCTRRKGSSCWPGARAGELPSVLRARHAGRRPATGRLRRRSIGLA